MKKLLVILAALALTVNLTAMAAAGETIAQRGQAEVSHEDIKAAEELIAKVSWDTSRAGQDNEIILSLPLVQLPYSWSLERDTGKYTGIRVEWGNAYFGQGGQEVIISTNNRTETGYYLNLINTETSAIAGSVTYIYYPDAGISYIPPENCLRGAVDDQGMVLNLYDLWGRPVVADSVYSPYFPDRYRVFSDLKASHWAYRQIYELTAAGYIQGYPDASFKPDAYISRAEFSAVLSRLLKDTNPDKPDNGALVLPGVEASQWSFGVSKSPPDNITREEIAAVIHASLKDNPLFTAADAENVCLQDIKTSKYVNSIEFCINQGFLTGYPEGDFRPQNLITRSEMAAVLSEVSTKLHERKM